MRFDLTDLRLFEHIVEAGSITGGAARTHMTLASASQRVLGMEADLGTPLLLRSRLGVRPTEAGRTLAHHARLVLQQMERLRGELGEYGGGLRGHVRLSCNSSAMTEHLPEALGAFLVQHPQISVDLEEQASSDIVDALRAGLCDIGVVSDVVDVEGLQHFVFRRDDRVRVRSFEAVCRMVEQGIGVGIVPKAAADRSPSLPRIRSIPIAEAWAARHLLACVRDADALPLPARRMLQHLVGPAAAQ